MGTDYEGLFPGSEDVAVGHSHALKVSRTQIMPQPHQMGNLTIESRLHPSPVCNSGDILDENSSAVARRVDEVYDYCEVSDDISSLRAHIVAADITASQRGPDDRLKFQRCRY